jgi:hypothetical protein
VNPTPCKRCTLKTVNRRLFCAHYSLCLDLAVARKWDGFTCTSCGSNQEEETTAEQWQDQAQRCGKVLKAIFIDRPPKYGPYYKPRPPEPISPEELQRLWEESDRRFKEIEGGRVQKPGDCRYARWHKKAAVKKDGGLQLPRILLSGGKGKGSGYIEGQIIRPDHGASRSGGPTGDIESASTQPNQISNTLPPKGSGVKERMARKQRGRRRVY